MASWLQAKGWESRRLESVLGKRSSSFVCREHCSAHGPGEGVGITARLCTVGIGLVPSRARHSQDELPQS